MELHKKAKLIPRSPKTNAVPKIVSLNTGDVACNAVDTVDEKPAGGSSWKEYWRIYTGEDFPGKCPLCGNALSEEKADGCHVKIAVVNRTGGNFTFSSKRFIIPGHHECNMQLGEVFKIKCPVKAVESIP